MIHTLWTGSHGQAGYRHGQSLRQQGINPMSSIPISQARRDYARQALPLYRRHYPELLDEIEGITQGLGIPFAHMADFLLSMYCFVFDNRCSCFAFSQGGQTVFGRNSDFISTMGPVCDSAHYRLDGAFALIGNTTAWTELEDGVNEHGLAAGLTFIYPARIQPGLNAGMLVRYLLEKCRTVEEALAALALLPMAGPMTITLADRRGAVAVAECDCGGVAVRRPEPGADYVYVTNHFLSAGLRDYPLPAHDGVHSHEREDTLRRAFGRGRPLTLAFAQGLLRGEEGFLCQYAPDEGVDTLWSSLCDLTGRAVYRAEGNPARAPFELDARLAWR